MILEACSASAGYGAQRTSKPRIRQQSLWSIGQELAASATLPYSTRLNKLFKTETFNLLTEAAHRLLWAN